MNNLHHECGYFRNTLLIHTFFHHKSPHVQHPRYFYTQLSMGHNWNTAANFRNRGQIIQAMAWRVRVRTKLTNRRNMRNFVRHLNHNNNNKNCISIAKLNTFCFRQGLVSCKCVSSAIASHLQLGFCMSRDSGFGVLGFLSWRQHHSIRRHSLLHRDSQEIVLAECALRSFVSVLDAEVCVQINCSNWKCSS